MTRLAKLVLITLVIMTIGSIAFLVSTTEFNKDKISPNPRYLDVTNIDVEIEELEKVETPEYTYYTSSLPNEENRIRLDDKAFIDVRFDTSSVETFQYGVQNAIQEVKGDFYSDSIKEDVSEEVTFRNSSCVTSKLVIEDAIGYSNTTVYLTCPVEKGIININYSKNTLNEHPLDVVYSQIINSIH